MKRIIINFSVVVVIVAAVCIASVQFANSQLAPPRGDLQTLAHHVTMASDAQPVPDCPWLYIKRYQPTATEIANGYTYFRITDAWCNLNASADSFGLIALPGENVWDWQGQLCQFWPDQLTCLPTPVYKNNSVQAEANFVMAAKFPYPGTPSGPYWESARDPTTTNSDQMWGIGLPNGFHDEPWTLFQKTTVLPSGATPIPVVTLTPGATVTPGPSPTPGPNIDILHRLSRALRKAADDLDLPQ